MSFRTIFEERSLVNNECWFGIVTIENLDKHYKLVKQVDNENRLIVRRDRGDGRASYILGTMYTNSRGQYHIGADCQVSHYLENNEAVLYDITHSHSLGWTGDYDKDFRTILAIIRENHKIDFDCFPYYQHKGY